MSIQFKGDTNNDGRINFIDIPSALRIAAGLINVDEKTLLRLDIDEDGKVTDNDVLLLLDHVNGINLIDGVIDK
jgi:hypothetical protein